MLNSEHLTCKVGLSFKSIVEFLYLLSVVELVRSWVSKMKLFDCRSLAVVLLQ